MVTYVHVGSGSLLQGQCLGQFAEFHMLGWYSWLGFMLVQGFSLGTEVYELMMVDQMQAATFLLQVCVIQIS